MEPTTVNPVKKSKPNLNRKLINANWTNHQNTIVPKSKSPKKPKILKTIPTTTEAIITNALAIDCEMVGIRNNGSMLARVTIVNEHGHTVIDKYVKPREEVLDYRTPVSGIRPKDIECGEEFSKIQKEVATLIKGKILVGHALKNDLEVLFLNHPRHMMRDTSRYHPLRRQFAPARTPSLKMLAKTILGLDIQGAEHDSAEDAWAVMQIYLQFKHQWERDVKVSRRRYE